VKIQPVTDCFASLNLKTTLILKACGFIEAHDAQILDVNEISLRLRVGHRWWERLLFCLRFSSLSLHATAFPPTGESDPLCLKPVEIQLRVRHDVSREERIIGKTHLPSADYSFVEVTIRPRSPRWTEAEFREQARRLLWSLRFHFMAC
jgi:hypothetical protein